MQFAAVALQRRAGYLEQRAEISGFGVLRVVSHVCVCAALAAWRDDELSVLGARGVVMLRDCIRGLLAPVVVAAADLDLVLRVCFAA